VSTWTIVLALLGLALGMQVLGVVLVVLNRVLRPLVEIKRYADDILGAAGAIRSNLEAVDEAVHTRELVAALSGGVREALK
jgi:hypothetical protein